MKFRAIPQIPRSADPAVQAVLEALKENFELMAGQRGPGDFIADQLGYTPLNKAGDTVSGPLLLPNQPAWYGNPATDYSAGGFPAGSTIMPMATLSERGGINWDISAHKYVCPKEGWYRVTWSSLQLYGFVLSLMKNGVRYHNGTHHAIGPATAYLTCACTVEVPAIAGDYIQFEGWNGGGYYKDWTRMCIEFIG